MKLSLSSAALLLFAVVSGVCAGSYARWSADARTLPEATSFALPFMLFSTASVSALLLSGVAAVDAAASRKF